MIALLQSTWALMLGIVLIMSGNGLQSSLLGLRGGIEGFTSTTLGVVMTGYYVGFLAGSLLAPRVIRQVGHIRVFAALASLAAIAGLAAALLVHPVAWFAARVVSGFAFAGLYIIAESWINQRSSNKTRGQLLSIYMLAQYGGLLAGQAMLNLADPAGFQLFSIVAITISLAVLPILLIVRDAPAFTELSQVSLGELYRISPLGAIGTLGTGLAQSAFFSLAAVYGQKIGFSTAQVSFYMMAAVLGGAALQWPVGRLSDRFDRRQVLTAVSFAAALIALGVILAPSTSLAALTAATFLFCGMALPIYSLSVAHTNDFLKPDQMVAASGTLVLLFGIGAVGGPLLVGFVMSALGPGAFWGYLAAVHVLLGLFALYRMTRRAARPREEQAPFVAMPQTATPAAPPRQPPAEGGS